MLSEGPADTTLPEADSEGASAPAMPCGLASPTVLMVCTSCRRPGDDDALPRPGEDFTRAVRTAAEGSTVTVKGIRCLGNCSRGLSAALTREGGWTYVFGGLDPDRDARALVTGAELYAAAGDGFMPWRGRPDILKRGVVARIPPLDFPGEPE
ncbi:DUF1636 family protein [Ancylobacter terrae]|uniref:DUF1636 family protein n=1 Tax=Ancylobacter sp. sgz301288 TaxID=3342077 RepID=UPI00385D9B6C